MGYHLGDDALEAAVIEALPQELPLVSGSVAAKALHPARHPG